MKHSAPEYHSASHWMTTSTAAGSANRLRCDSRIKSGLPPLPVGNAAVVGERRPVLHDAPEVAANRRSAPTATDLEMLLPSRKRLMSSISAGSAKLEARLPGAKLGATLLKD